MEIEITHKASFVNMDAIITHGGEEMVIPMNYRFTGTALLDHQGQMVSELNQHWSRRTDDSKNKLFRLYRCIRRCWDNHVDFGTGKLTDFDVLVESVAPYMLELLNQHNVDMVAHHMDTWYNGIVPNDLPDHSDDPLVYTYEEYQELQAMMLSMRPILPVIEMLRKAVPAYPAEEKLMRIHVNLMKGGTALYQSRPLYRLYTFVEAFVAKNGGGDPNRLMAILLYKRLTHYPLASAPHGASIITEIYKSLAMETHPAKGGIPMKNEYRMDFVPTNLSDKYTGGEIKGVQFLSDKK